LFYNKAFNTAQGQKAAPLMQPLSFAESSFDAHRASAIRMIKVILPPG